MTEPFHHVAFVGSGAMATVLALLLETRGVATTVWGPNPGNMAELIRLRENRRYLPGHPIPPAVRLTDRDTEVFRDADVVVSAIPTQFLRGVWTRLAPHLPAGVPVVSVAKGIENDTILRPSQVLAEVLGAAAAGGVPALAALSGPSVAEEMAHGLPATVAVASADARLNQRTQLTFTTDWFRVYTNEDLVGVELAGALKNVIALAAGILDGLEAGINAKSALLSRGLAEITRLGTAMGARPDTFFGVTGVGDLATTCFSPTGRNRSCGELLGQGKTLSAALEGVSGVVEGVPTARAVVDLAARHGVEMPIASAVNKVLFEGLDPRAAIAQLMSREPKPERVG